MASQQHEPRSAIGAGTFDAVDLQSRIGSVIDGALAVKVADYEDVEREALEPLRLLAREVLVESLRAIAVVQERCDLRTGARVSEVPPAGRGRGLCDVVDQHHRRPSGIDKIADLAFVAAIGLRHRLSTVEAVAAVEDTWDVISECSGAVREVLKSMTALESAVCEFEGIPTRSTYYGTELERALLTRRAYVSLRQVVVGSSMPEGEEVPLRLRLAAAAIAKLVSRDVYASARVHDRRLIRQIQERIRGWLSNEPAEGAGTRASWLLAGLRIHRDLANVAGLILAINHRTTLRAHDTEVLDSLLEKLLARGDGEVSLSDEYPEASSIVGRDAEIDALVQDRDPVRVSEAIAVLRQALRRSQGN